MARDKESTQPTERVFCSKTSSWVRLRLTPGWLKEIWGKWPSDESIEELLAVLDNIDKGDLRGDSEWRRMLTR